MSERSKPVEDEILEEAAKEAATAESEPEEVKEEAQDGPAGQEKDAEEGEQKAQDRKAEELNEKYMRLLADFQNQKKRFEKEKSDIYLYANEDIVKNILGVLDNFERAFDNSQNVDPGFKEGIEMIFKQLWSVLEKAGVSEIKALGEDFDPNFHNAVMMEDTDEYESGKVSCVLQKGYMLNSRVVRPAMVKVAN